MAWESSLSPELTHCSDIVVSVRLRLIGSQNKGIFIWHRNRLWRAKPLGGQRPSLSGLDILPAALEGSDGRESAALLPTADSAVFRSATTTIMLIVSAFKPLSRTLIAKRLIAWLGFQAGNLIQALLFGAAHMLIFIVPGRPTFTPTIAGLFLGVPQRAAG